MTRISTGKNSKQDYQTPPDLMSAITSRFGEPDFDLAARSYNTKCANYFAPCTGPEGPLPFDSKAYGIDAFDHKWSKLPFKLLWLNCEFNASPKWSERCRDESVCGANILLLVPASVGAVWFVTLILPYADVFVLRGRVPFTDDPYNKDVAVCHFHKSEFRKFCFWDWKSDTVFAEYIRRKGECLNVERL
jgi:hypothetical protein